MNVHIANLDPRITTDQLKDLLTPILRRFKIEVYDLHKKSFKTFAHLAVLDVVKAQALLAYAAHHPTLLRCPSGNYARLKVDRDPMNPHLMRILQKQETDMKSRGEWQKMAKQQPGPNRDAGEGRTFKISSLECGRWETATGKTVFVPYYMSPCSGSLSRDGKTLIIRSNAGRNRRYDILVDFYSITSLALSSIKTARTLTITLTMAPKFFEDEAGDEESMLSTNFRALNTNPDRSRTQNSRSRVSGLPDADPSVVGSCLSYRLTFQQEIVGFWKSMQELISYQVSLTRTPNLEARDEIDSFPKQLEQLKAAVIKSRCFFGWKFQIQALWSNGLLSPREVQRMIPAMQSLRARLGDTALMTVLQRLTLQLPFIDASTDARSGGMEGALTVMRQQEEYLLQDDTDEPSKRDEVLVYRVVVTPTGTYLSGPEQVVANRVLRQYRAHHDCFLRVVFADEDEERLEFDLDFSNDKILRERFLNILRKGLDIAGEHFDFLGFSHSSLRSQTCWFMRPFVHEGSLMFANRLIRQLGDFTAIRSPAKCAARIGQAFSETTSAVQVDPSIVKTFPDVKTGRYIFTDGCGTISKQAWKALKGSSSAKAQPTSYQIRYKGVKGMLSLDTRLEGRQIRLRESMVKFSGSPSNEIEICSTNARRLSFKLNRQIIKILEDLGIGATIFERLQEQAIHQLRLSARSTQSAIGFMGVQMSDSSTGLPTLLKCLQKIGIDISEDMFLREVLGALLQIRLREIKYRTRIPVPEALTLYGISDETGWLAEGQVFVTYLSEDSKRHLYLNGRIVVTRSPALHPGDIQHAQAVVPPDNSSLWDLQNCIVFSQKGTRDLPSMLSGGDLDGDLYNIIFDEDLIPERTVAPAEYLPVQAVDIGRTVTSDDMTGFFVDFMENDQLGRIATAHQVIADQQGTKSETCIKLAALHSTAVDFSKSGVPVDVKQIPRTPRFRPDFMAPSASTKVEKGIERAVELAQELPQRKRKQRYLYYESSCVIGILYRAVDEDIFFRELADDSSSIFSKEAAETTLGEILDWVKSQINPKGMRAYVELAAEARNYYEVTMRDIMSRYTVRRDDLLTEKEVFTGTILGRSGAASRYQREQSDYMRSRFNWELRDLKSWMEKQTGGDGEKFLYLAAACLHHAVTEKSNVDQTLSSFGWIAAAMCVPTLFERHE